MGKKLNSFFLGGLLVVEARKDVYAVKNEKSFNLNGAYKINNNSFINPQGNIVKGKAYARMSAQSVAHLLMVLFIVIGNIAYYYSRKES